MRNASNGQPSAGKPGTASSPGSLTAQSLSLEQPNFATRRDDRVRLGLLGGWHALPAGAALQQRVARLGYRLVPSYQTALAPADPSKIHFRFAVMDDNGLRSEFCDQTGLILIPRQIVERLRNDDQLAAVLADLAASLVGANGTPASKDQIGLVEQRARVALALMADAGFDPRQALEAWRLLEPKRLPADLHSLKYPRVALYQFGILNLQYPPKQASLRPDT